MKTLEFLAKVCAVAAGALLTLITLMTCVSVIGRNTTGWTIVGDFELTGAAAGAAIALFMPWCQARRGNINVDFFTAWAPPALQQRAEAIEPLLLGLLMVLVAWRTTLGGLNAWHSKSGSMMLGFPEWAVYCCMVPPFVLTALIAFTQALRGYGSVEAL